MDGIETVSCGRAVQFETPVIPNQGGIDRDHLRAGHLLQVNHHSLSVVQVSRYFECASLSVAGYEQAEYPSQPDVFNHFIFVYPVPV
jgi:hypothetical protein